MSYDLIIVGAGTAGMACAVRAVEFGAKVCVIEKAKQIGGALHWSGGHMSAGGTKRQNEKGIEDSPEKHLADIQDINEGTGDVALIELAVNEAPKTIDWLDSLGFEFAPECPRIIYGHIPYNTERTHYGKEKAMSIYKVLKPLWDSAIAKGQLQVLLEHEMIGLQKTNERYDTVKVRSSEGEKNINAEHIVLTTGGYGSDPAFFASKHPGTPLVSSAYPDSKGDVHRILENEGAVFDYAAFHIPSLAGIEMPLGSGRANFNEAWAMILTSVYRRPREIYVNTLGERFMNEDEENADIRERIAVKQPDWKIWLVFDEAALMERNEDGSESPIIIGWDTKRIKAEAQKEASFFSAPTIEGLAAKTELPETKLQETIATFNKSVESGKDKHFGRDYLKNKISQAPFYAILVHPTVLVTFGGIKVNPALEIIDKEGNTLSGLYGAGEILGLGATSGKAFCSGMAITPALSFGRILGKKLATKKTAVL